MTGLTTDVMRVLVGADSFAVPLAKTRDVFDLEGVVPIPLAPEAVVGLAAHRGRCLCVLSLGRLLGLAPTQAESMALGIDWHGDTLALAVTHAEGVASLCADAQHGEGQPRHPAIRRYLKDGSGRVAELNIHTLISSLSRSFDGDK